MLAGTAFAQAPKRTCGTQEAEAAIMKADPGYQARKQQQLRVFRAYPVA